jgi:hypothetical protein
MGNELAGARELEVGVGVGVEAGFELLVLILF